MQSNATTYQQDTVISTFFANVYKWMTLALAVTALVAWQASTSEFIIATLIQNPGLMIVLVIVQLAAVILLAGWVRKMSFTLAIGIFLAYAALTGLTFSTIFLFYTAATIFKVFAITAGVYGAMALYGYTTSRDLSGWGSFLFMSLIGIILGSVINFWLASPLIDWMVTYGGIIIFAGLTAYDHQKLKHYAMIDQDGKMNLAVHGALSLYLDFINLFILLLRVFGGGGRQ
jgi:hypothetical protein